MPVASARPDPNPREMASQPGPGGPQNGKNPITYDVRCMGGGVRPRELALKIALERRGWSQKDVLMNRKLNLTAIDRESIIWKQNHSPGGSSMVQSEPECLTHGGRYAATRRHLRRYREILRRLPSVELRTVRLTPARRLVHALPTRSWIHTNS